MLNVLLCVFIIRKSCFLRRGEFVLAQRNSSIVYRLRTRFGLASESCGTILILMSLM